MQRTVAAFHVDPDRVHVTGLSQGGAMTWRTLCAHSDMLASVAPVGSASNKPADVERCTMAFPGVDDTGDMAPSCIFEGDDIPVMEVPILYMFGTNDYLVDVRCALSQRDAVIDAWDMQEEEVLHSDDEYTWTRYANASGTVFEFIQHEYVAESAFLGGHCYPGSTDFDPPQEPGQPMGFACLDAEALDWGHIVMNFFRDHPRR
jgi:poly(3-hydroxybutyrate) depolymerase